MVTHQELCHSVFMLNLIDIRNEALRNESKKSARDIESDDITNVEIDIEVTLNITIQ